MKSAKSIVLVWSIASTIFAIQISGTQAPADSVMPRAANSPSAATQPAAVMVKIDNFAFQPNEVVIAVGATVTWQNADDVPHTATSMDDPQVFDSGPLDTDDKFSFTFSKPGTYNYYCKVHPHMKGVVTVK